MLSVVSGIVSTEQGGPMWSPTMIHWTLWPPWTSDLEAPLPCPMPVTSGGHYCTRDLFKPVHLRTPCSDIWWWPFKHVWFPSGCYASTGMVSCRSCIHALVEIACTKYWVAMVIYQTVHWTQKHCPRNYTDVDKLTPNLPTSLLDLKPDSTWC